MEKGNRVADAAHRVWVASMIYVAAVAGGIILHNIYPLPWIGAPLADLLFAIGWLLGAAAIFLLAAALRAWRSTRLAGEHRGLVTSGPYSFSRNPIYLSAALLLVAGALIWGIGWLIILALVAGFATSKLVIEGEERRFAGRFGKKYRDYQKKVRRWI